MASARRRLCRCGGSRARNLPADQSLLLDELEVELDDDVEAEGVDAVLEAPDELDELSLDVAGADEAAVLDDELEPVDVPEPRLSVL
jgi:hypothetical protein